MLFAHFATATPASFHNWRIQQLFSNADGSIQFIVLTEQFGDNGEPFLTGHAITSTQGRTQYSFVFLQDLPSSNMANRSFLIATPGFASLGLIPPDYTMRAGFLFIDGETVNYAFVDQATYAALPTDGINALYTDGTTRPNHRFVTSQAERQKMIDQGFVPEGAGIGVGMCVPG